LILRFFALTIAFCFKRIYLRIHAKTVLWQKSLFPERLHHLPDGLRQKAAGGFSLRADTGATARAQSVAERHFIVSFVMLEPGKT